MSRQIVLDLRHCERIGVEPGKLLEDAADRIEQLEADNAKLRSEYWCYTCPCEKKLADQKTRIEQLEAALREINKRLNDKDSWLAQSIDCRNIAEISLREK